MMKASGNIEGASRLSGGEETGGLDRRPGQERGPGVHPLEDGVVARAEAEMPGTGHGLPRVHRPQDVEVLLRMSPQEVCLGGG